VPLLQRGKEMNKRRLAAIARWLEAGAPEKKGVKGFNMKEFGGCGTACCIAGTARQWWAPNDERSGWHTDIVSAEVLGMEEDKLGGEYSILRNDSNADKLFFPDVPMISVTPAWAARCIRKLIATGEVDWQGTEKG
jgi:hypothetical protein